MFNLFNFDRFIYPGVAKIIFAIGVVIIVIWSVVGFFAAFAGFASFGTKLLAALGALLGGALSIILLRIATELVLVLFSIHDTLKEQLKLQKEAASQR